MEPEDGFSLKKYKSSSSDFNALNELFIWLVQKRMPSSVHLILKSSA